MPRESWVAKWNEIRTCVPGVYAINVTMLNEDDDIEQERFSRARGANGHSNIDYEDDDLDDFIAKDDEAYWWDTDLRANERINQNQPTRDIICQSL